MTISEMISKFRLQLVDQNGEPAVKVMVKPTAKQLAELKAAKPEIITELQKRQAAKEAARKAAEEAKAAELEGIKNGTITIKVHYHDGEYLSGYGVHGQGAEILLELGLAKQVSGWGYHVGQEVINVLGGEFTYEQAAEYARPAIEAVEAEQRKYTEEIEAKFTEAKNTGKPVLLRKWTDECCDPGEECNLDLVTQYAMPDGTTKTERQHTW